MDQSQQPRGDFVAFLNRDKQPGDRLPIFEGRIAKPGSEEKHPLTLWAHEYTDKRTGEVKTMYSGTIGAVSPDADPQAQIAALMRNANGGELSIGNITLNARQIILFPNGFKADAPDKKRPDIWGGANFGDGSPVVRASVWLRKTRNGQVMLSGATSYPIPGKTEAEMQAGEPDLQEIIESGKISKGLPEKVRGKAGRTE